MAIAELEELEAPSLEILDRLNKDLKTAATTLTQNEIRLIVDLYYQVQDFRIASANIVRSQPGEPNALSKWVFSNFQIIEKDIKSAMGSFAAHYKVGRWLQSQYGIAETISAGLLAHLDIRKAKTPGNFLSFAGLIDPSRQPWEKKTKRPWNAKLKTLVTVRMGETLVKFSGNDKCVYGKLYVERKKRLIRENAAGEFSDDALVRSKEVGSDTIAYRWYSGQYPAEIMNGDFFSLPPEERDELLKKHRMNEGDGLPMLPPGHLHSRARRHMAQMVLCHLHYVMYEDFYGKTYEFKPYIHSKHFDETSPGQDGEEHTWIMMPHKWPNDALGGAPIADLKPGKFKKKQS